MTPTPIPDEPTGTLTGSDNAGDPYLNVNANTVKDPCPKCYLHPRHEGVCGFSMVIGHNGHHNEFGTCACEVTPIPDEGAREVEIGECGYCHTEHDLTQGCSVQRAVDAQDEGAREAEYQMWLRPDYDKFIADLEQNPRAWCWLDTQDLHYALDHALSDVAQLRTELAEARRERDEARNEVARWIAEFDQFNDADRKNGSHGPQRKEVTRRLTKLAEIIASGGYNLLKEKP